MTVTLRQGRARGTTQAPPSKSMAHRLLLLAGLSEGTSVVRRLSDCEDVRATLDCLRAMGIEYRLEGDTATVYGRDVRTLTPKAPLCCRESGSTLRFLLPLGWLMSGETTFLGASSLLSRPMDVYESLAKEHGLTLRRADGCITVGGQLEATELSVAGNISSQFISGLLFALAARGKGGAIHIQTTVESRSYILLTIRALSLFGVQVEWKNEHTLYLAGGQHLVASDVTVEGDYSGSAFLDALSFLGGEVETTGLCKDTLQGDAVYKKYFPMLASGIPTIHIGDCPDLGPILFSLAAAKHGGVFSGTRRLKIKESDRAAAMAEELSKLGSSVTVYDDTVVVYPAALHAPTEPLWGHNDHRIVMALAVLLTLTGGTIRGAEAVAKSFPDFFQKLGELGIEVIYEADN